MSPVNLLLLTQPEPEAESTSVSQTRSPSAKKLSLRLPVFQDCELHDPGRPRAEHLPGSWVPPCWGSRQPVSSQALLGSPSWVFSPACV